MVFDVVAGDGNISYAATSAGEKATLSADRTSYNTFNPNNASINSITVGDSAQQGLTSMVNVNAAGSVVPVQINLTVLINSKVENLSSVNGLTLSNYTTLQLR